MPPIVRSYQSRHFDIIEQSNEDNDLFDDLVAIDRVSNCDNDDDDDHDFLLIHHDYNENPEYVLKATGFTFTEFWELYSVVEDNLRYQFGNHGKPSHFGPEDSFYLFLQHLHHNLSNIQLAIIYKTTSFIVGETLHRAKTGCHQPLVNTLIIPVSKADQIKLNIGFKRYPHIALIIDCSIQECPRPAGGFSGQQ